MPFNGLIPLSFQRPKRRNAMGTSRRFLLCFVILVVCHLFFLSTTDSSNHGESFFHLDNRHEQLRRVTAENPRIGDDLSVAILKIKNGNPTISLESAEIMRKVYTFFDRVEQLQNRYEGIVDDGNDDDDGISNGVLDNNLGGDIHPVSSLRLVQEEQEIVRPKIYTFFHRIELSKRSTGMTDRGDDEMLALWQEEWTAAGFDTHILTLDDARAHPRFAEFEEKLEHVPLETPTKIYNRMCYFRHLAMAAVGGGYMSDYDVLPMIHRSAAPDDVESIGDNNRDNNEDENKFYLASTELPVEFTNDEDIHVYNGFIPSLMSGSASKWETLAFQLLENGSKHADERIWTDMLAMLDLQIENQGFFKSVDIVLRPISLKTTRGWSPDSCEHKRRYVAVHFSHHSFKESMVNIDERAQVAKTWLDNWRSSCQTSSTS